MDVSVPQERIFERTREQLDEVFSWVTKEIVGVVRLMPQERIQQRPADEIVVPEAQIQEHIVQVGKVIPQERFDEQIGDIFVHQIVGEIVPVVRTFPQECIHRCTCGADCRLSRGARLRAHHEGHHWCSGGGPSGVPSTHRGGDG